MIKIIYVDFRPYLKTPVKDQEQNTFLTPVKKTRKFYAVSREKWFLGSNATKTEFDESETGFLAISQVTGDLDKMDNFWSKVGFIFRQCLDRKIQVPM